MGKLTMTLHLEPSDIEALSKLYTPTLTHMIQALRSEEGDALTLLADNPDGPPNNAVECCGAWTDYNDRRFEGATLTEAVFNAYKVRFAEVAALATLQQEGSEGG